MQYPVLGFKLMTFLFIVSAFNYQIKVVLLLLNYKILVQNVTQMFSSVHSK